QITNALSRNRFGLFGKVCADQEIEPLCRFHASAHFHFAEKRIAKRNACCRRLALGFATDLFPGANPAEIDIGKASPRFFEHDRGAFWQLDSGAQNKPLWPMGSIESADKHMGKFSPATCALLQSTSVALAAKYKAAFF